MKEKETIIQPEKPLDDKRKTALLRYLGIMFVVAFLFVLMSMIGELRSSEATITQLNASSTSALQKAEQLQEDNRQLATDVAYLEGRIEELEKQLEELETDLSDSQALASQQSHNIANLEQALMQSQHDTEAVRSYYELLLQADSLDKQGDDISGILSGLKENIKYFADYAMKLYENLTKKGEE